MVFSENCGEKGETGGQWVANCKNWGSLDHSILKICGLFFCWNMSKRWTTIPLISSTLRTVSNVFVFFWLFLVIRFELHNWEIVYTVKVRQVFKSSELDSLAVAQNVELRSRPQHGHLCGISLQEKINYVLGGRSLLIIYIKYQFCWLHTWMLGIKQIGKWNTSLLKLGPGGSPTKPSELVFKYLDLSNKERWQ